MIATPDGTATKIGRIVQVIGSIFDAEFEEGRLPEIFEAAGLRDVCERQRLRTISGSMVLLSARR